MSDDWSIGGPGITPRPTKEQLLERKWLKGMQDRDEARRKRWLNKPKPVYQHWLDTMRPVCFGKATTVYEQKIRFNSMVALMRDEGRDNERIKELIDAFARMVSSGTVDVRGKSAWLVFRKSLPRIEAALQTETARDTSKLTHEDFRL